VKPSVLRVALFGFESTGKSRLAEHLSAHFAEPWAPEYVRGFWEERAGVIKAEDLETIGRGQAALEDAAAARARRVVFCDTELLSCTLWNDLLSRRLPAVGSRRSRSACPQLRALSLV
jgi:nicotinamide riboside kinase